jgi:hypothetical protein
MADKLSWQDAQRLAGTLITIGHPIQPAALDATALDLTRLCKGGSREGREYSPLDQALELVQTIRTTWTAGWAKNGGTAGMFRQFRELFAPEARPEFQPYTMPPPPACSKCSDTGFEIVERKGYSFGVPCGCGARQRPSTVCPECGGKTTTIVDGNRRPCNTCLSPERRREIAEWLKQQRQEAC